MALAQDFSGAATGAGTGFMVGGPVGAGIGGAAGLLAGIFSGNDDTDQAQANIQKALDTLTSVGVPPDLAKPLILQQLQVGGSLTPAYEQALSSSNFSPSQINANAQDTTQLQATLSALKGMTQGGLNPEQLAAAKQLQNQVNSNTQSQIQGLLQRQAAQGQSGSGSTLAAQLNAVQNGAQNESQGASNIGAQGFQAQQQALQQLLGGQSALRSQDLNTSAQNAQLKQQADLWKAQNSSAMQARNTANTNAAAQANWARQNQVGDTNTQMYNQEQQRQVQAEQQQWADQLALAQSKANAYTGAAQNYSNMANNSNQAFNTTLQGVGGIGAAIGQYQNGQQRNNLYAQANGLGDEPPSITSSNGGYANGGMVGSNPLYMGGGVPFYADGGMAQSPDGMQSMAPQNPQVNAGFPYFANGGHVPMNFLSGGPVPGQASIPGNSFENDTVPAMLSPGEIVVPRSVSHDPRAASKFVVDQIDKNYHKAGPMFSKLHERLKSLEKKKDAK